MKRYIEFFDDAKTSAVEKLNNFLENLSKGSIYKVAGYQANTDCAYILLEVENELANQLDEPQPVKVPQFVADWIEEARKTCKDVADFFDFDFTNEEVGKWFMQERPFDLVARAWLDGYEVEKEKRHRVRLKGLDKDLEYLNFKYGHVWVFSDNIENEEYRTCHTRKELEEAGFGWVFNCEGVEIEEVEG